MPKTPTALFLLLTVSACAGGSGAAPRPTMTTPAPSGTFRAPQIMQSAGVESIIGQPARALTRRFGEARIDLSEGDARKLQFASDGCVLDIYLYPLSANSTPVATHIEVRERQNGGEMDRARCIAQVESSNRSR